MAKPLSPERLAEFDRMRRRLVYAFLALLLLLVVGTVGYTWIGAGQEQGGVFNAFYMTVITFTTVGYGEVIDLSPGGRLFTVVLLIGGMGIGGYAVALLAAFLIEGHVLNVFARFRMQKTIESMSGHYLVCGSTPAARHVVGELTKTEREVVLVADSGPDLEALTQHVHDLPAIVGDPADDKILVSAGIERAAGVVACLAEDRDNVIVTLTARRLAPKARIIAASEKPENDAKMRVAGADAVVSPSRIGGLRMASELVRPTVVSFLDKMLRVQSGDDQSLRVEEIRVPEGAGVVGRTLEDLGIGERTGAVLLAAVKPGENRYEFNPPAQTPVQAGATLLVMATAEMCRKLESLLA